MKLAICLEDNDYSSNLDRRFGRAGYFIIIDSETKEYEIIENDAKDEVTGAGLKVVKKLMALGVDEIVAEEIGPKAETLIEEFEIPVYRSGDCKNVDEVLERYSNNTLEKYSFSSQLPGLRMA